MNDFLTKQARAADDRTRRARRLRAAHGRAEAARRMGVSTGRLGEIAGRSLPEDADAAPAPMSRLALAYALDLPPYAV